MGVADSIEPSTMSDMGRVAKQMFDARDCPARPPTTKIIGICAPKMAWAATRTATLRLARLSSGRRAVSVMAQVLDPSREACKRNSGAVDEMRERAADPAKGKTHGGNSRAFGIGGGEKRRAIGTQGRGIVEFMRRPGAGKLALGTG